MGGESEVALWVNVAQMSIFASIFGRAAYHSRSKTSVVYHLMSLTVCILAFTAYLMKALRTADVWIRYLDWGLATPLLLIDLAFLAGMPAPLVAFLALLDILMVGTGYVAEQASEPAQIWVMFCLSTAFFIGILWMLLAYMRKLSIENKGSIEERAFRFLAVWTTVLWCAYPLIFILFKSSVIDRYVESIIHVVLDFFAKGLFGMILVGSREVLENEHTCEALLAMALLGIRPNEHGKITRRASMSAAHMPAIEAVRGGDDAPVYVEVDISGYANHPHDGQQQHSQAQGYRSQAPMPVPMPTSSSAGLVQRQQSRKGGYNGANGSGGAMRPTQPVFSFSVDESESGPASASPTPAALSLPPRGVSANPTASPAGGMRAKGKGKGAAGGGGGPLTSPAGNGGGFGSVSTSEATAAAARRASASRAAALQAATAAAASLPGRETGGSASSSNLSPDRHPGLTTYDMYAVRQQREAEAAAAAAAAAARGSDDDDDDEEDDDAGDYDGDVDFARPDGVRLVYGSLDEERKPRTTPAIVPPLNTGGGMGGTAAGTGAGGAGGGAAGGADPFVQLMMRAQGNPALMAQMMALMLQAQNGMGSPLAGSGSGAGGAGGGQSRPGLELTSPASRGGRM